MAQHHFLPILHWSSATVSAPAHPPCRLASPSLRRALLGVVLLLAIPTPGRAGDLVVGMSAAFTGPTRALGIELYRGSMAYLRDVNLAGGLHGRKIRIEALDDGYNPNPAIDNTIHFIQQGRVLCLFGYVGTPTVTRMLPLLKLYGKKPTYLLFPFTGAEPQRNPPYDAFVFNLRASYAQETEGLVDRMVALGRTRIAVFFQADAYGRGGWEGVRQALERRGLAIAAEATYRRGTPFGASLAEQARIISEAEPDAVISIGAYAACAAFIRDARDGGLEAPIANVSFVDSANLLGLLQEASRRTGHDYTRNLLNSQVVPSHADLTLPAVREYRALMDRYDVMPPAELLRDPYTPRRYSPVSFEGYLNARLLTEILDRMGEPIESRRIPEVVEAMGEIDLGLGQPVRFDHERHQGLDRVYFTTAVGDRFVTVRDWERWRK